MKKLFKSVAVLMAAALAIGSFASCKQNVSSGDKFGIVGNSASDLTKPNGVATVELNLKDTTKDFSKKFKSDIIWYKWTEGTTKYRGPVAQGITVKTNNGDFEPVEKVKRLVLGNKYIFKFPQEKKDYIFYMYQESKGDVNPENLDTVGVVHVYADKASKFYMDDSDWRYVPQQGEVAICINEPQTTSFFPNGDYSITEVWPLKNEKDNIWSVRDDLKYELDKINYVFKAVKGTTANSFEETQSTRYFLFPANMKDGKHDATAKSMITTYQPKRGDGADPDVKVYTKKNSKGEIIGVSQNDGKLLPKADSDVIEGPDKITGAEIEFKAKREYWGAELNIAPHVLNKTLKTKDNFNKMFIRPTEKSKEFNFDHSAADIGISYYEVKDGDLSDK